MARKKSNKKAARQSRKANRKKSGKKKKAPIFMLLPFKGMMYKKLKKMGVNVPNKKLRTIVELFHTNVVKKKNLEDSFDEYIIDDIIKIIADVFGFIKQIFKKKKSGEPVAKDIEDFAQGVTEITDKLDKAKINPEDINEDGTVDDGTGKKIKVSETGDIKIIKEGKIAGIPTKFLLIGGAGLAAFYFIKK